jgi:ankyrin repeat protein
VLAVHDIGPLREVLSAGADPNELDKDGRSPLSLAVNGGFADGAALLLEHGAKPVWPEQSSWVPLHAAAHAGNVRMCRLLVEAGASSSYRPMKPDYFPYRTPFQRAVESGQLAVVAYFVEECGEMFVR